MNALVPRTYAAFPGAQFTSSNAFQTQYYSDQLAMQPSYFSPTRSQPFYGHGFNSVSGYPVNELNRNPKPTLGEQFLGLMNQLDGRYRQEQYNKQLEKVQRRYWQDQANRLPPPIYTSGNLSGGYEATSPSMYHYEQEIRYVPFPIYVTPSTSTRHRGNTIFPGGMSNLPIAADTTTTMFGATNTMNLLPKIRVIFIPTGSSPMQQPCMGPLTMPPFLFNRIAQPLCSFPLPPPLPQVASLPLTPGIQEMVMQRYVNPVAVLPFSSNYQMPQPMLPLCPSVPQQAPPMPVSTFQPVQSMPPAYMPISSASAMPMMPALPPPPLFAPPPMMQIMQSTIPQAVPSMPMAPIAQPLPAAPPPAPAPAPQVYIPPPPPPIAQVPAYMGNFPSQPYNGNYPSAGYSNPCRACPPAPPSLNIPVTGHCWVQHCAACHHVPMPVDHPNLRPNNGRITPLLRHPTVPQYIPDQAMQLSMPHTNANPPELMRPWLRKTPPLPPGAVLISDEYVHRRKHHKHRNHRSSTRTNDRSQPSHPKPRSATITSTTLTNSMMARSTQSKSPVVPRVTANSHANTKQPVSIEPMKLRHASSLDSSSSSGTPASAQYEKVILAEEEKRENSIPKQLAAEARTVNLRYNYPAQELPSVYLNNRYIKSSSEGSSLSSNTARQSPSLSTSSKATTEDSLSIREEEKVKQLPPLPPKPPKASRIVIREYATTSPSTMSTNSSLLSDAVFSIIGRRKNSDSISTTSTIKAARLTDEETKHKSKS